MNPKNTITATLLLLCSLTKAQVLQRIDPPFWYHNLGSDTVSLLLYGNFKAGIAATFTSKTAGAEVIDPKIPVEDGYHMVQLVLKDTHVHKIDIQITAGKLKQTIAYQVHAHPGKATPIQASDVMYLIMPDRFANGDARNDNAAGMLENANREQLDGRHGGDILGIQNHLNHLKSLGVSALWLTPVLENNQPRQSYHGYACTDHYRIDPRFGSNEEYLSLTKACATQDIKIVLDVVYNHCGSEHAL